jgi:glycosyltransferase involved in cell wall biosynthesis
MLTEALFYPFAIIVSIQAVYYVFVLSKFTFSHTIETEPKNIPVSVVICAKNEAENLKQYLPLVIDQAYQNFEIVLVDDNSSDDTLQIMESFAEKNNNIKIVKVKPIDKFWGNKKYALTLGIKAASNNFLLFTDADCQPISKDWIKHMAAHFSSSKSLVLGYGGISMVKNSLLNKLIRYETILTAIQYFSYAKIGMPYMGVGRNLAYRKDLFFENSGFMSHMHIKSGDDDLFVNQVANSENTTICFNKESFTYSEGKSSFKDWVYQKRRHILTSKYYKLKHKFVLGLFYTSQLLFWLLAIMLIALQVKVIWVLGLILLRLIIQQIVLAKGAQKLDEGKLMFWIPFLDFFLVFSQLIIFTLNLISKPKHWK